jgi:hypothetical protein
MFTAVYSRLRDTAGTQHYGKVDRVGNSRNALGKAAASRRARKPIFVKLGPQLGLGYRRNRAAGTWVMRVADGKGGNSTTAIGAADDFQDADGSQVLDF